MTYTGLYGVKFHSTYLQAAKRKLSEAYGLHVTDILEGHPTDVVNRGKTGAWVKAWVWISDEDIIEEDKRS